MSGNSSIDLASSISTKPRTDEDKSDSMSSLSVGPTALTLRSETECKLIDKLLSFVGEVVDNVTHSSEDICVRFGEVLGRERLASISAKRRAELGALRSKLQALRSKHSTAMRVPSVGTHLEVEATAVINEAMAVLHTTAKRTLVTVAMENGARLGWVEESLAALARQRSALESQTGKLQEMADQLSARHKTMASHFAGEMQRFAGEYQRALRSELEMEAISALATMRSSIKEHECTECRKRFSSAPRLKEHRRQQHLGHAPHRCRVCNHGFVRKHNYREHMWTHLITKPKPYQCLFCRFAAPTKKTVADHIRVRHSQEFLKPDSLLHFDG